MPYSGLLLPDEVDLRELAENIALANPDVLDTSTMDAVLKRIVKDIWYDSLPSIKRRRNKEVSHGVISILPKSRVDHFQRLEIEAAPNGTRSVSSPSQVEPNGLKPLPMLLTRCPNLPKMNLTA